MRFLIRKTALTIIEHTEHDAITASNAIVQLVILRSSEPGSYGTTAIGFSTIGFGFMTLSLVFVL